MRALCDSGPVAVSIEAGYRGSFHHGGVMHTCGKDAIIDHAVLLACSSEYLHKAGVLEEGDKRGPRVLLPNYMLSPSNCLATTSFFGPSSSPRRLRAGLGA